MRRLKKTLFITSFIFINLPQQVWAQFSKTSLETSLASDGFRPGRYFSLFIQSRATWWDIKNAGDIRNEENLTLAFGLSMRYLYHTLMLGQFWKKLNQEKTFKSDKLGFVAGTELAFYWNFEQKKETKGFAFHDSHDTSKMWPTSIQFPSLILGFSYQSQHWLRLLYLTHLGAEYFPWLTTTSYPQKKHPLSPIPYFIGGALGADIFSSQGMVLNVELEYHYRWIKCVGTSGACDNPETVLQKLYLRSHSFAFKLGYTF